MAGNGFSPEQIRAAQQARADARADKQLGLKGRGPGLHGRTDRLNREFGEEGMEVYEREYVRELEGSRGRPRNGAASGGQVGTGRVQVGGHTRTVKGQRQKVRDHTRQRNRGRKRASGWENFTRALRFHNKKNQKAALAFGSLALFQAAMFFVYHGVLFGISAIGFAFAAAGWVLKELTR